MPNPTMTAAPAGAILFAIGSYVRALGPRRAEHGSWHLCGQGHADYGAILRQTILCCAADHARQCCGEPFRRGSRALTAGMGQLRALKKLAANGQSLNGNRGPDRRWNPLGAGTDHCPGRMTGWIEHTGWI